MAFPTIAASNGGGGTTTTSPTTTVPAGVLANDLIVFVLAAGSSSTTVTLDSTSAGTWTILKNEMSTLRRPVIFYKVADGSESSVTLTHTFGTTNGYKWVGFLVRGTTTSNIAVSTTASGSSTSSDPANLSASWGAADNLWIEVSIQTSTNTITAASTNFSGLTNQGGNSSNLTVSWAYDENAVGTYDPDAMTVSTSTGWNAHLLVFGPASSGLSITSVNTTNTAFSAQTDSAVVGTGLSASVVCTYAGIACTNESASSSTSLKITFPNFFTNNIKLGRNYEFKVVG